MEKELTKKRVYLFEEGDGTNKKLLGGKGAGLATMTQLALPVPPGFTITTEVCKEYNNKAFPEGLMDEVRSAMNKVEEKLGRLFGDAENPLLVSVRSGAAISMPGMMDTILNLGLNDETVMGLFKQTKDERFTYDVYRRFVMMFGDVALSIKREKFDKIFEKYKDEVGVKYDHEVPVAVLKKVVKEFKELCEREMGRPFPEDPWEQLETAIKTVFESWDNPRAIAYRDYHKISHDLGTAVNVQAMVFGNMGNDSASGVVFTRNPASGEDEFFGEYLPKAQGEDVVAGVRTPKPVSALSSDMPRVYEQLVNASKILEKHYKDVQDIEFTVERSEFYILQTRSGKRTGKAAIKIAHDFHREGIITKEEAIMRVTPEDIENCIFPAIPWEDEEKARYMDGDQTLTATYLGKGLPAGPGAAVGMVAFDADTAERMSKEKGLPTILVALETSPDDFHGMAASKGVLTMRGGMTSHAALVARQIGKRCIVGAEASGMKLTKKGGQKVLVSENGIEVFERDWITLDGFTGKVYVGELPIFIPEELPKELVVLLEWCDEVAEIGVKANADTPEQIRNAMNYGATGVGLCRTEHMFFGPDRLPIVQRMILAENEEERVKAVMELLPFQREDFKDNFEEMGDKPLIVRLIDPPLHEFLPSEIDLITEIYEAKLEGKTDEELRDKLVMLEKVRALKEFNPMLGFRGVRLCLFYPEIIEMQARAIFEAVTEHIKAGKKVFPEVMVPLVGMVKEFAMAKEIIDRIAKEVMEEQGVEFEYLVGTMIEVPRAALTASEIVEAGAKFFSFGTNDLHQMTMGFSRDDVGKFLPFYIKKRILKADPFVTIEKDGVGRLMKMCVDEGRAADPKLEVGICGEQGGDPESIELCYQVGLDYVSCSPFRVPVARLAAAHATLKNKKN